MRRWRWTALALLTATLGFFPSCGGGGGTNTNPTPVISFVFPAIITAGSQGFTLFINGADFMSNSSGASIAFWNGTPLSTNLNSDTDELEVSVPASFVVNPNVAQITVVNPAPGGGPSNAVTFTIEPVQAGGPVISSISPPSVASGATAFTLTVNGSNFSANDVVTWNGQFRTSTFIPCPMSGVPPCQKMTAQIMNTDVASPGIASVAVLDTVSGTIASLSVQFIITGPANPTPSISSFSPTTATAGGPAFELIISGSNFVATSIACFNNSPLASSFITSSKLGAWVPAADIAHGGVAAVSVTNSGTCGLPPDSSSLNLSINNPVPTITGLSPSTITAGSQNFTLVISGTNFISGINGNSVALWNGSPRSTTFDPVNQQLDVLILASDVATSGTAKVSVQNPPPGGGTSSSLTFTIAAPQTGGPVISFLAPADVVAGSASFTLTVNGLNFVSTDAITWNGEPQITNFVSATQLTTQINAAFVTTPGLALVAVMPTTGASSPSVDFFINPVPTITGLSPSTITAGSQNFALVITGTNFISGPNATSFGFWNGSPRSTIFNSMTGQLEVLILASDVATAGVAQVTVVNPGGPGGSSAVSSFTIAAPQAGGPTITPPFAPANAAAGGSAFTLTVNGSNFVATDVVTWNGQPRTTAFVGPAQLTAQITAADIQLAGFGSVAVMPTSGASSPSVDFTITGPSNLIPSITSISPPSTNAGGPAFELTVNGANFSQTSSVMWNATALATSFINSGQLIAWVPASDIASSGSVNITVFNPAPGGGTSTIFLFTIH